MKKTLLIVLLLVPFFGFSQTTKPIESFLSIKFGSSKAEVIAAMKAKGYNLLKSDENSDTNLEFGAVNYAHRQTQAFAVEFVDNKCYEAIFDFKPEEDPKTIDYYNNLVRDINDVYGPGKPTKKFRYPYAEGDGQEIIALEGGYADFYTDWIDDNNKNLIEVKIATQDSDLMVVALYIDKELNDLALAHQKNKDKGDM
ncbi:hypothetical protein HDF19_21800 [Mucilaginibacter sp. E4BP6]|uniref:hypothetical protein n=1 Tax=Mucilaginibacter sp. E4BP6 TaxID=2723089 RepID=UPI0015CA54A1|nr:hypothetical protein [Mucilaginibacter sp. E4BP6]NYE67976.1 hypothetical protein [Mucilaginibacter sp. E4BP6]